MKISLNWLTEYVDVSISARDLGERLTQIGLCCDEVIEADDDILFDLDVTSNRPDCLGHLGVAREVSAMLGVAFRPPVIGDLPAAGTVADLTRVDVLAPDLCPRYTARVLRGVKIGPSPRWMVARLEAMGLRGINNVVDVTNYVLMEYSQPLHCFDYDKLAEHRIVVRRARNGGMMVSIDGTQCELDDSMLVIADAAKPVAIAGVMGGLSTEVDESSTNILIESAQFDPLSIRQTSRRLALMSESNYRFERGVDPVGVDTASLRACQLILELAGGELAEGVVDVWAEAFQPYEVALRPERCCALLGVEISADRQAEILDALGLAPRGQTGRIVCAIPSRRADLRREVDLIEEIARLAGYDRIPVCNSVTHAVRPEGPVQRARREAGQILSAAGFDEALTFTFIDASESALFAEAEPVCVDPLARRTNNALRGTLLPSLLRACKANQDVGNAEVSLWELSDVFSPGPEGLPDEHVELALVSTRALGDMRGAVEALASRLAPLARLSIEPGEVRGLAERASARVRMNGAYAGVIGYVSPRVQDYYGLERTISAATVRFEMLLEYTRRSRSYQALPKFPAVRRDLSLIVDEAVTWRELADAIDGVAQPIRDAAEYVTTFRGAPVPEGRKSVTVTLVYRSDEGTLRKEQVDEQVARILAEMEKKFRAELRA